MSRPTPEPDPPEASVGEAPEEALRWLEALAAEPESLARLDHETLLRIREATSRIAFPSRNDRKRFQRERRKKSRNVKRKQDEAVLAATSNRALKRSLKFPTAPPELDISDEARALLEKQAEAGRETAELEGARLFEERSCYVCKEPYTQPHPHYDSMCPVCADLNWQKRNQTADLTGRVALVTGSRVKIGYEAALMLLRAGATVVATTRFPVDSAKRFAAEEDYEEFRDRLQIHGLDLRQTPAVEWFAQHLLETLPRLDFLIHNACQTVRRPPAYYRHLVDAELPQELPGHAKPLLAGHEDLVARLEAAGHEPLGPGERPRERDARATTALTASQDGSRLTALSDAPGLSQLDLLAENGQAHLFPTGMLDGDGQQLDLRDKNSWRMELAEVPTVELIEVQLVNSIAPFVLTARLKPLMLRVKTPDKHVVNVSAMEGQFYRALKTTRHPHTNMAKAALNMMTRTSAGDFVQDGIHMNSVDTGWVTDEDPFEKTVEKESEQRFVPPLDSIDGAARVVDPIFTGFNTGVHCWGQFLKDYKPTSW